MKQLTGEVTSTKMQKSCIVKTERFWRHPLYKKAIRKTKSYLADSNNLKVKEGDCVIIQECRPLSKKKRFRIIKILK